MRQDTFFDDADSAYDNVSFFFLILEAIGLMTCCV